MVNAAGNVAVDARDNALALGVAGGAALTRNTGYGLSGVVNVVTRDTEASISADPNAPAGSPVNAALTAGGNVSVDAQNSGQLVAAALAGAVATDALPDGSDPISNPTPSLQQRLALINLPALGIASGSAASGFGLAGDATANVVVDTTRAFIDALDGNLVAQGSTSVQSTNSTELLSLAGAGAFVNAGSSSNTGIGGSFSGNALTGDTEAYIAGGLSLSASTLSVSAARSGFVASLTAGAAAAPEGSGNAVAGSVSVNVVLPTTLAYLHGPTVNLTGSADVTATVTSQIWAIGGAVGYGSKGATASRWR